MGLYFTGWAGDGTSDLPFRPEGTDQLTGNWSVLDLRPDTTASQGKCLVSCAETLPGATLISDGWDEPLSFELRRAVRLALNLDLDFEALTTREVLAELLLVHGGKPGRWRNLQPNLLARYELWLAGEQVLDIPVIQGGAAISENFNTADTTALGPQQTWTEVAGNWVVASNQARGSLSAAWNFAVADTQLGSDDMYAEADIQGGDSIGVLLRGSQNTGSHTNYVIAFTDTQLIVERRLAGAVTVVGSAATTDRIGTAAGRMRAEIEGGTIRVYWGGALQYTITDSSPLSAQPRAGICIYNPAQSIDNFAAGLLGAGGATGSDAWSLGVIAIGGSGGGGGTAVLALGTGPAIATGTGASLTTASFTPPTGSVLVAMVTYYSSSASPTGYAQTVTSNNGLTWTRMVRKSSSTTSTGGAATGRNTGADIWYAHVTTDTSMTVTTASSSAGSRQLRVMVLTGAETVPAGAVGAGSSASGLPSCVVTTTRDASYVFACSADYNEVAGGTAGSGQTSIDNAVISGSLAYHTWRTTVAVPTTNTARTMNLTAGSGQDYTIAAMEVRRSGA